MSSASAKRMPLRLKSGRVENVSYILDARFSGIPHLAANDGEDDRRHHFVQEEEHVTQDHFRLPRQYPTLDEIIFDGQKESIAHFIKALLPFGTTLDGVVAISAKQEIEARKESTKKSGEPKQPVVFFSYFNQPDYGVKNPHSSLFASVSYFTSAYHSVAASFKGLFAEYVAPNYINPSYTKRVRHRMRKIKSYRYGVIDFSKKLAKYAAPIPSYAIYTNLVNSISYANIASTSQKTAQYSKTNTHASQYARPIVPELTAPQKPYSGQVSWAYSDVVALSTPHRQENATTSDYNRLTTGSARVAIPEIKPELRELGTMSTPYVASLQFLPIPAAETRPKTMEMNVSYFSPLQSALSKIESKFEYKETRNPYLAILQQPITTGNLILPALPHIPLTTSSVKTIELKLERTQRTEKNEMVHQETPAASMQHKHRSVGSIDQLFQTGSFQPVSESRNSVLENIFYLPKIEVGSTLNPPPATTHNELYKPYITQRGETLQNVFKEDIHISKDVLQRAEGKDYLSVVYSELSRLGYKVGIVEQVYKDTKTGKMAKGKILVLLDRPDLHIEILVGGTKDSTLFQGFVRNGDNPLTEKVAHPYATVIFKAKDVYIKELDNRFETPKKGKEIERCYAPLPYQKAA